MKIVKVKMKYHKDLTPERWFKFSFDEQMANVGADIGRAINWRNKDKEQSKNFLKMGLILFDAIIADPKNKDKQKELLKVHKELVNYFSGNNFSESDDEKWNNYFYGFNYAVAVKAQR